MNLGRRHIGWAAAAAAVALSVTGCSTASRTPSSATGRTTTTVSAVSRPSATPLGFAWFRAQSAPVGWATSQLPDHAAVLSFPAGIPRVYADPGAIAVGISTPTGLLTTYLNATPQQATESMSTWTRFRIAHLRDDATRSVTLLAAADHLTFRGGPGACVLDDYVTRIGSHHYREVACLVSGRHGGSVLVAAALASSWAAQHNTLYREVDSYVTR